MEAVNERVGSWDFYTPQVSLDPHPLLREVRETGRAMWHETYQAWIVPHYKDIVAMCRDEKNFSAKDGIVAHNFGEYTMLAQDGALHRALRMVWNPSFLKKSLERLAPQIREVSLGLLTPVAERLAAGEPADMAPANRHLPVEIIASLLGVQAEHRPNFGRWSDEITHMTGYALPPDHPVEIRRVEAQKDVAELFREEIARRRVEPSDDLIGQLVASGIEEQIGESGMVDNLRLLLVAGNETTSNWFGNCVVMFDRNRDYQARARADRSLIAPAIEEALRMDHVVQFSFRRAATDEATIGDVRIPKGDQIIMVYGAANRDPEKFGLPDSFDAHRENIQAHVGFGHGVHSCMGKELARLEGAVYFDTFFDLVASYEVTELDYALSFPLRGPQKLIIARR